MLENLAGNMRMTDLSFKEFVDKIGTVGGTLFLLYTIFEFFVSFCSRCSYRNRLIKRLYFARVNINGENYKKLFA